MARRVIDVSLISDLPTKQNFELVRDYFANIPFLKGSFKFVEFTAQLASYPGTYLFQHNLNFIPKDVILLSSIGSVPTFNYAEFNLETISLTIPGQATIRAIIGTYSEN